MDAIEAHARRLPQLDERWVPRPYPREELERGLLEGGAAGVVTHPLDNVLEKVELLLAGDPDKQFGLSGLPGDLALGDVLDLIEKAAGSPIDRDASLGPVRIDPAKVLDACEAMGDRLADATARGASVLFATGHPGGLDLLYGEIARLAAEAGAKIVRPADGLGWWDRAAGHGWRIGYHAGVALLTDGERPRHTHRPDAMERMLAETRPDLVMADHGFAGAAIGAGVETLSVADVNDPALLIAKAQGRTEVVVVMDDHVAPDAYWPCLQAIASRFPNPS